MLSIPKLIALAAILFAIWYGLRWLQRLGRIAARVDETRRAQMQAAAPAKTEELTACPVCGTYVSPRSPSCGRPDCPGVLRARS